MFDNSGNLLVGNTIANIAFGEFIFSGKNLFDPTLIGSLMANPFSAHTYSLMFGLMGGALTFILVSTLFMNGTLAISKKPSNDTKAMSFINTCKSYAMKAASCLSVVILTFSTAAIYRARQIAPFLMSHANIILFTSASILGLIESYNQCYTEDKSTIANLFVTVTTVSTSLVTLYLNLMPGSLFFQVMPAMFAKGCAVISAIANAELTLPLNKFAIDKIDEVVNNSNKKIASYVPKPVSNKVSHLLSIPRRVFSV